MSPQSIPVLFTDLELFKWRRIWVPLRKNPGILPKVYIVNISLSFPQRDLQPFTRLTVLWGKGNNQTFQRSLDTGFELTPIPEDPNHHHGPQVRIGAYEGLVNNGVLAQVHLTEGPMGPQIHHAMISPVLKCIIGRDILSNWQNPYISFLRCRMRAIRWERPSGSH